MTGVNSDAESITGYDAGTMDELDALERGARGIQGGLGMAGTASGGIVGGRAIGALPGQVPRGLGWQNPMFKHALGPYRGGFTNAGRALTKHPNIVGASSAADLIKRFVNNAGINTAAAEALKHIMRNGSIVSKMTKAFGQVMEFKLPSGLGARFNAITNEFLGFLGRGSK